MSDAIRRALLDELERAFVEFSTFVRELPADLYDVVVPGEDGTVRQVLGHVVSAGYGHINSVAKAAGGRAPERRFTDPAGLDDPETFVAALLDVPRFAREALEGVPDSALETRFAASWGQEYDGEQMFEHATCHPGRHARQLRRFLDGEL
jgi:hypothetical protein